MRTLKEELEQPLSKVERTWLRRTMVIVMTIPSIPFAIIIGAISTVIDMMEWLYGECW